MWEVRQGDALDLLCEVPADSVDLIATDPPYGISFMGKQWDKALPDPAIWRDALRVAKPGAFAFVMCTPRSDCLWRMCRDLEEAGWDLTHAQTYWIYRSGFPKALDIGKDFDRAAFVEWVKAGPAEAMGWGPEEIRKAASAAVNGLWDDPRLSRSADTSTSIYDNANGGIGIRKTDTTGLRLLASLLARFPDAPGVRVKVGEGQWSGRNPNGSPSRGQTITIEGGDRGPEVGVTSPSTPLALAWDGWKSPGLKPACECIIVCQKPFSGPVRENVKKWGVGGFNVAAARVPFAENGAWVCPQTPRSNIGIKLVAGNEEREPANPSGRFPANLLCSDLALGEVGSRYFDVDKWSEEHGIDEDGWAEAAAAGLVQVAKPSKGEKEEGLLDLKAQAKWPQQIMWNGENGDAAWRKKNPNLPARNHHPTCKPVRLMSYLIHLACPPGGLVLDPFMGSGTTGVAAVKGGWDFLGFELEPDYCEIARRRIKAAQPQQLPIAAT